MKRIKESAEAIVRLDYQSQQAHICVADWPAMAAKMERKYGKSIDSPSGQSRRWKVPLKAISFRNGVKKRAVKSQPLADAAQDGRSCLSTMGFAGVLRSKPAAGRKSLLEFPRNLNGTDLRLEFLHGGKEIRKGVEMEKENVEHELAGNCLDYLLTLNVEPENYSKFSTSLSGDSPSWGRLMPIPFFSWCLRRRRRVTL